MTKALLLWVCLPLTVMAAHSVKPAASAVTSTNAVPVEVKPPVINIAAPNVTVASPTFPEALSVRVDRDKLDFLYDCGIAAVGFVLNGVLLFIGSMVIARKIEKYKTKESLKVSFTNEMAKEMDKVSKLLFQVEYAIEIMSKELSELDQRRMNDEGSEEERSHSAWVALFRRHADIIEKKKETALVAIEESRFWLGKENFARFAKHLDELELYEGLMESRRYTEAKKQWFKIDATRPYAAAFIK